MKGLHQRGGGGGGLEHSYATAYAHNRYTHTHAPHTQLIAKLIIMNMHGVKLAITQIKVTTTKPYFKRSNT